MRKEIHSQAVSRIWKPKSETQVFDCVSVFLQKECFPVLSCKELAK